MKRAIVIGAGISGLCVTKALSHTFDEIVVVERDTFAPQTLRQGIPQSHHTHVLLGRGQEALNQLFPDFRKDSINAGCPEIRWGIESGTRGKYGWLKKVPFGFTSVQSTRLFLEERIRNYISSLPNVRILGGTSVVDLLIEQNQLKGVITSNVGTENRENLLAEFVLDCSGRNSSLSEWLAPYGTIPTKVVNARLVYGSQLYKLAPDQRLPQKFIYFGLDPERSLRAGALLEVEDGHFMVTLAGALGERPPTDQTAFLEYAKSLCEPQIFEAMTIATPVGPITRFGRTENRRIELRKMDKWPDGLLAVGDSICANNPVYGQGMSIAAMQAEFLMKAFNGGRKFQFNLELQKKVFRIADWPWQISTGQDLAILRTEQSFKERAKKSFKNWLSDFLFRKLAIGVIRSKKLSSIYASMIHLKRGPMILFRPDIFFQLLCVR